MSKQSTRVVLLDELKGTFGVVCIMGTVPVQSSPRLLGELFHNILLKIQLIEKLSAYPTQLSKRIQP